MIIRTHFQHVSVPPDFDQRLNEWLTTKLAQWNEDQKLEIDVYLTTSAPRQETHGAMYECHMTAMSPRLHKKIVTKHANTDFWAMLYECVHKTRRQLQKITSSHRTRRRREKRENRIAV
jgi:ribosome-associated translation inhibitor RaiA